MAVGIVRVLIAGVCVWLLSTILALASCGGLLGDDEGAPGGDAPGPSSRNLLRTATTSLASLEQSAVSKGGSLRGLLEDAIAIVALSDLGILRSANGEASNAAVSLARHILSGGGVSKPTPSLSPMDEAEAAAKAKRAKRLKAKPNSTGTAATVVKDSHYTHQTCFIGADEAEVSSTAEPRRIKSQN